MGRFRNLAKMNGKRKRQLEEENEKSKKLENEVPTHSPYCFWIMLIISLILYMMILYTIYRRNGK
jgi:hypothetical protein